MNPAEVVKHRVECQPGRRVSQLQTETLPGAPGQRAAQRGAAMNSVAHTRQRYEPERRRALDHRGPHSSASTTAAYCVPALHCRWCSASRLVQRPSVREGGRRAVLTCAVRSSASRARTQRPPRPSRRGGRACPGWRSITTASEATAAVIVGAGNAYGNLGRRAVDVIGLEIRRAHVTSPAGITFPHFAQTRGPGLLRSAMRSGAAQTSGGTARCGGGLRWRLTCRAPMYTMEEHARCRGLGARLRQPWTP